MFGSAHPGEASHSFLCRDLRQSVRGKHVRFLPYKSFSHQETGSGSVSKEVESALIPRFFYLSAMTRCFLHLSLYSPPAGSLLNQWIVFVLPVSASVYCKGFDFAGPAPALEQSKYRSLPPPLGRNVGTIMSPCHQKFDVTLK